MQLNKRAYKLGSKRSIIREIFEYSKQRATEIGIDNVFDFSIGNPNLKPPEEVNKILIELITKTDSLYLHSYTSAQGDTNTRESIAQTIKKKFSVSDITANDIYMTCGAVASLTISLGAVMSKGEECIVFAPFFTEYRVFIENAKGKVIVSFPTGDFQIDLQDFEKKISEKTRAIILNSPNNPSGVVYSEETIISVCKILNKKSQQYGKIIYLIADEPYREIVYDGITVPYLMNYYDNTLVCYSYSKSLSLPGERIGYIALSPKIKDKKEVYAAICGAGRSFGFVCAPSLFQHLIERCADIMPDIMPYKKNRDLLYFSLTNLGFECVKPDGAFYLFVKSPDNNAYAFYEKAKKYEILLVPCDDFGVQGYVRIAYCVDKKRIINSLPSFKLLAKDYFDR